MNIIEGTSVDGPGLRTSIYVAGCAHQCPGCHNPSTWDFNAGKEMTIDDIINVVIDNDFDVTLSGGDPMYQPEAVAQFASRVKALGKSVWLYTGFTFEQLMSDERKRLVLTYVDVVVDGPFVASLRDETLRFRGSSNQRIIAVAPTLATGHINLYPLD